MSGGQGWLEHPGRGWWRGPEGVRGVWRALAFGLLVAAGVMLADILLALLAPRAVLRAFGAAVFTPAAMIGVELILLVPVLGVTWVMAALEGRSLWHFGLAGPRRLVFALQGLGWGILPPVLLVFGLALTGHDTLRWGGLSLVRAAGYGLAWLGASLVVGFAEEFCFRGYFFASLARGHGVWVAALVSTVTFAALHVSNSGEGLIGIGDVFFGGLLLALALVRTGSLWWSIGFHTGWDYAENFILGTPDSGQLCLGTLLNTTPYGAAWISGGATGPEGSLFDIALDIVTLILAWFWLRRPREI